MENHALSGEKIIRFNNSYHSAGGVNPCQFGSGRDGSSGIHPTVAVSATPNVFYHA